MPALATNLRNDLGRSIVKARRISEAGARKALGSLAVERHEPHGSMSLEERKLRNRLRAHGRQLGDVRDKQCGSQSIDRLTHEVAYEHWHRMLFARFLAENDLLIHLEHGVSVSLDEIEELAREAGEDPHSMAARFAQDSLPQIFRSGDPALEVTLAPETRQALDKLLDSLPVAVFTADDSLGWTYQFWQKERKKAINDSGEKIGADELPAVTQLFTEHYMVLYLFHNTIGAWHAGNVLAANPKLAEHAQSEEDVRQAVRLHSQGGYDFDYLRFVREAQVGDEEDTPTGPWRPAAGTFVGWPKTGKELKFIDPCCGSGHFLIEGFELLVRLRMDEEMLGLKDAIRRVLADNLYGLELDPRCTQIAAFNLAMAAWKLAGTPIELPAMHIACAGQAVGSSKIEWTKFAGDNESLCAGMERLYDLFEQAPELGSLIDPKALRSDLLTADFAELQPLLEQSLKQMPDNAEEAERAVAAQGMALAANILSGQYTLAITNVPFLARAKMDRVMTKFAEANFSYAKSDLSTVFIARLLRQVAPGGTVAVVSPQNWYFLSSYKKLRKRIIDQCTLNLLTRLGPNAFRDMNWWAATTALSVISTNPAPKQAVFRGLDLTPWKEIADKQSALLGGMPAPIIPVLQNSRLQIPDYRFSFDPISSSDLLESHSASLQGVSTADLPRFSRCFWENIWLASGWETFQGSSHQTQFYAGRESVINQKRLEDEAGQLGAAIRGRSAWNRRGIAIRQMRHLPATLYDGGPFDTNVAALIPTSGIALEVLWAYCTSEEFLAQVRSIDQKTNVTNSTLVKVPFDLDHWKNVAAEKYPNGLPDPQTDDLTQWLFHGHPAHAEPATVLQVAIGRLLGYRWPPENDPKMRLADEARGWVARCDVLKDFTDEDGIVCLSATRGERSAVDRIREHLSAAFGSNWSAAKEHTLLEAAAGEGNNPANSLDIWLRDKFFEEHCKLFRNRPFVWHIWDGNKDGFHCLVNAHKLTGPDGEGRRTLEAITYSYLGDWIDRQKADQQEGLEGADARLGAAQDLQGQLEKILEGEPPYDLFVRWKALHKQGIGWEPDINDGVRLNIRPFMNAELRKGGKKGAGILRWKPTIKWKKDRGKEPQSLRPKAEFPWFWGCNGDGDEADRTDFCTGNEFDGNRWNDLHFTRDAKEMSRAAAAEREKKEP